MLCRRPPPLSGSTLQNNDSSPLLAAQDGQGQGVLFKPGEGIQVVGLHLELLRAAGGERMSWRPEIYDVAYLFAPRYVQLLIN